MKRTEYNKLQKKITKIVTDFMAFYEECNKIRASVVWKLDDCNSIVCDSPINFFYDDWEDELDIKISCQSKYIQEYLEHSNLLDDSLIWEKIINPIYKKYKKYFTQATKWVNKIEQLDCDWWYFLEQVQNKKSIDYLVDMLMEDYDVQDEILYSYDNETWVEYPSVEEFIESGGLVDGDKFWIKTNGKIKQHTVVAKEIVVYEIGYD